MPNELNNLVSQYQQSNLDSDFDLLLAEMRPRIECASRKDSWAYDSTEDCEQELLCCLYRSAKAWKSRGQFLTFWWTCWHNHTISQHLNRKRQKTIPADMKLSLDAPMDSGTLADWVASEAIAPCASRLDRQEALEKLSKMMAQFKPLRREVMRLFLEDNSEIEIANQLRISKQAVNQHLKIVFEACKSV